MMSASEIRSFTWLNGEARQAVMDAFNAVSQWRNEISLANDRYLTKVIDRVVAAQRAQGWPNSVTVATREHLLRAAKVQTQMIDQSMDDWQHQLKSKATSLDPSMVRMTSDPMSEMMRLGEMTSHPTTGKLLSVEGGTSNMQHTREWRRAMPGSGIWSATLRATSGGVCAGGRCRFGQYTKLAGNHAGKNSK
jgi:hypothetical protein